MKKQLLIAAVALLVIACKKAEQKNAVLPSIGKVRMFATLPIDPENKNNPFDDVGLQHNKVIDYALQQQAKLGDSSLATINKCIAPYLMDTLHMPLPSNIIETATTIINDGKNGFKNIIESSKLSATGRHYLRNILNVTADTTMKGHFDFKDVKARFIKIEDAILADKNLPAQDRSSLLAGASVARYSTMYWFYIDPTRNQPAGLSIFKKFFVIAHDVVGTVLLGGGGGAYLSDAARAFITKNYKFFVPDFQD